MGMESKKNQLFMSSQGQVSFEVVGDKHVWSRIRQWMWPHDNGSDTVLYYTIVQTSLWLPKEGPSNLKQTAPCTSVRGNPKPAKTHGF
jgi:hypothetical protein